MLLPFNASLIPLSAAPTVQAAAPSLVSEPTYSATVDLGSSIRSFFDPFPGLSYCPDQWCKIWRRIEGM